MRSALLSLRSRRMHRPAAGRLRRSAVLAISVAAATSVALPAVADAAPAPRTQSVSERTLESLGVFAPPAQKVDQRILDSLGAFAPAIIGSVVTKGPDGKINPQLIEQAKALAAVPGLPTEVKAIWQKVIDFLGEPGRVAMIRQQKQEAAEFKPGEPEIPQGPNAPKIQEFLYPTVGFGCMPNEGNPRGGLSLGRALVTAGPQDAPAPGPKRGEAGYVYTSLGTGPAIDNKQQPLLVTWLNIDTGQSGQFALKRNPKINATDGPGTFTGIAKTGKGRVVSTIYGHVTTRSGQVIACPIIPTIGLAIV